MANKTHKLHNDILTVVKDAGWDIYSNKYSNTMDSVVLNSMTQTPGKAFVPKAEKVIVQKKTKSIAFTEQYWKKWRSDLVLLEDISDQANKKNMLKSSAKVTKPKLRQPQKKNSLAAVESYSFAQNKPFGDAQRTSEIPPCSINHLYKSKEPAQVERFNNSESDNVDDSGFGNLTPVRSLTALVIDEGPNLDSFPTTPLAMSQYSPASAQRQRSVQLPPVSPIPPGSPVSLAKPSTAKSTTSLTSNKPSSSQSRTSHSRGKPTTPHTPSTSSHSRGKPTTPHTPSTSSSKFTCTGGSMSMATVTRSSGNANDTQFCEMVMLPAVSSHTAPKFNTSQRFKKVGSSTGSKAGNDVIPPRTSSRGDTGNSRPGTGFSTEVRFHDPRSATPGPGTYAVTRMFEEHDKDDEDNWCKPCGIAGLSTLDPLALCKELVFGYGCSHQEHVLYGLCLDGLCGRRSQFEQNDTKRMSGSTGDDQTQQFLELVPSPRENSRSTKEQEVLLQYHQNLEEEQYSSESTYTSTSASPLHIAAQRGDVDALTKLSKFPININCTACSNREDAGPRRFRITPLHIAVLRNQYDAVCALIDLFDGRIDVNCQDAQGDTPLHMASRMGLENIVLALIDADASPTEFTNSKGKLPRDYSQSHDIYQMLGTREESLRLTAELEALKAVKTSSKKSSRSTVGRSASNMSNRSYQPSGPTDMSR